MGGVHDTGFSGKIKEKAHEAGFDLCGIARVRILNEYEDALRQWCDEGMHSGMNYLARETGKRANPEALLTGAKSVIVTGLYYYTDTGSSQKGVPVISRYSLVKDYHKVILSKLGELLEFIKTSYPEAEGRIFVDSGPVFEKPWAVEAGLGWQGSHSIVINRDIGSFFFIGILFLDIELEYDKPYSEDYCGTCRKCIDACPSGAINNNRTIDARKCISNLTIENRGPIPVEFIPLLNGRAYGCDICQEVCPWNKDLVAHNHPEINLPSDIPGLTMQDWLEMDEENFNRIFSDTPVSRVKFARFRANVEAALKSLDGR
jgi:epoxyqueuosine reductase